MKARRLSARLIQKGSKTYTRFAIGNDIMHTVPKLVESLGGKLMQETKHMTIYEVPGNHLTILIGSVKGWVHSVSMDKKAISKGKAKAEQAKERRAIQETAKV